MVLQRAVFGTVSNYQVKKNLSSTGLLNQTWTLTKSMEKSLDTCNSRILLLALNIKTTYYEH